ncbi:hypothetical protein GGS23DRAFT_596951 [Durotheca rogersii]|uniref:uncharacterized protein n=1 Tax=Durotheca rogersii TaxID=419775 RepID=UPI00221EE534|nr:uncharacterized protein GGS23DRAFT_596951 [Durotheca rogersii]KAI5863182.1 hypothetical protein GGS23DRAFT_596951 [Durotheca rogersii]
MSTPVSEENTPRIAPPMEISPVPTVGSEAPVHVNLELPTDRPTIIVFLRHCGCPFAEKTFKNLTALSVQHAGEAHFVAVSHSTPEATERWVVRAGGNWEVNVVVDHERELYARWGLGTSTTWHVMNPLTLYRTLRLVTDDNIWGDGATAENGSRWQTAGAFAVDPAGIVRWARVAASADDIPDLDSALAAVGVQAKPRPPPEVRTAGFL